jgi:Tripartite tricarboxylate transporter TctB family
VALANLVDGLGTAAPVDTMMAGSALRPCLGVAGSVVAFALLIERVGYLAAVMVTVLIASLGSRELTVRQALMLAVVVAAVMAVLFVGLLDQPLHLIATF